jgi:hypothetical protein
MTSKESTTLDGRSASKYFKDSQNIISSNILKKHNRYIHPTQYISCNNGTDTDVQGVNIIPVSVTHLNDSNNLSISDDELSKTDDEQSLQDSPPNSRKGSFDTALIVDNNGLKVEARAQSTPVTTVLVKQKQFIVDLDHSLDSDTLSCSSDTASSIRDEAATYPSINEKKQWHQSMFKESPATFHISLGDAVRDHIMPILIPGDADSDLSDDVEVVLSDSPSDDESNDGTAPFYQMISKTQAIKSPDKSVLVDLSFGPDIDFRHGRSKISTYLQMCRDSQLAGDYKPLDPTWQSQQALRSQPPLTRMFTDNIDLFEARHLHTGICLACYFTAFKYFW